MEIITTFLNKRANHYKTYKISIFALHSEINRMSRANFFLTNVDGMPADEYQRQNPELFLNIAA